MTAILVRYSSFRCSCGLQTYLPPPYTVLQRTVDGTRSGVRGNLALHRITLYVLYIVHTLPPHNRLFGNMQEAPQIRQLVVQGRQCSMEMLYVFYGRMEEDILKSRNGVVSYLSAAIAIEPLGGADDTAPSDDGHEGFRCMVDR